MLPTSRSRRIRSRLSHRDNFIAGAASPPPATNPTADGPRTECEAQRVRLFLRLTTDVNDRLRTLMPYQVQLSRYIDEALTSSDPPGVEQVPAAVGRTSHAITALISYPPNGDLGAAPRRR